MPRITFPVALASVFIIGLTCAKYADYRVAERERRVQKLGEQERLKVEIAKPEHASAPACPASASDFKSWGAVSMDSFPVIVPQLPQFQLVTHDLPGRLTLVSTGGDQYVVAYGDHAEHVEDWPQYALVDECQDVADFMVGTIQTALDKSSNGFVKVVIASYQLPNGSYVSFHGTTRYVARQAQFVTAAHYLHRRL